VARRSRGRERRRWQRLPIAIPFFVRGVDERAKEFLEFATAFNISAGGALVACRRDLLVGTRISLEIPAVPATSLLPLRHTIRTARARVVGVRHLKDLSLLGVRFARPLIKPTGTNS
jgi:hypothetical protein